MAWFEINFKSEFPFTKNKRRKTPQLTSFSPPFRHFDQVKRVEKYPKAEQYFIACWHTRRYKSPEGFSIYAKAFDMCYRTRYALKGVMVRKVYISLFALVHSNGTAFLLCSFYTITLLITLVFPCFSKGIVFSPHTILSPSTFLSLFYFLFFYLRLL